MRNELNFVLGTYVVKLNVMMIALLYYNAQKNTECWIIIKYILNIKHKSDVSFEKVTYISYNLS
jgi:hypothetical protein